MVKQEARNVSLIVNKSETRYMVLTAGNLNRVLRNLIIGGGKFDEVKGFKYLGNTLNNHNRMSDTDVYKRQLVSFQ